MTEDQFKTATIIKDQILENNIQISAVEKSAVMKFLGAEEFMVGSVVFEASKKAAITDLKNRNTMLNVKFEKL